MKKSNALICLLLSSLCLFLMIGCGQGQNQTKNPAVTEIRDQISESVDISMMRPEDEETLVRLYEINMDDVEEFILYTAPTNLEADELTIIKAKNNSKAEEIKQQMAQRVEEQANSFKDYLPEEYALIEKHVLKSRGNYILLTISEKADEIEEIFDGSFK